MPRKAFVFLRDINTSVMILASQAKEKMKFLGLLGKPKIKILPPTHSKLISVFPNSTFSAKKAIFVDFGGDQIHWPSFLQIWRSEKMRHEEFFFSVK